MKIIAVVVTYNRCALLQRTVNCLRNQSVPLSEILVVNNGATDGTGDWLAAQTDLRVVTQENVGGSGGFHRGIDEAYRLGAERIWCMDDDVFPRPDCLEKLLAAEASHPDAALLAPRRLQEGRIVCHDFTRYNLSNPFASMYAGRIAPLCPSVPTYVVGTAFEGPFFRRELVERIGLPNKELFIFCDDTDYCLRAHLAGLKMLYVPSALMDKEKFFDRDTWAERERKKKWKRFYQVRNSAYLNHHYGRNAFVRHLRSFIGVAGYVLTALVAAPLGKGWNWSDIPRLWKAYRDGVHERLGKM
ncbi:MAG: glycosyltransferase family 2 protein [Alloprevotella sp.]|nr:glycosyltransferase family 2 protein [Bacteroidales bacterium]MDD7525141.1 glycosyltransferase family 2 protein [Bacteroidales bacterium]MDY5769157.1 glycosyltransferase family 2 protein [Alloprevotella sp.]